MTESIPRIDAALLGGLIPMNGLTSQQREELAAHARITALEAGESFTAEDDAATCTVYVLEGELEILVEGQPVDTIAGGTDDARHAIVELHKASGSARAKTPVRLLTVERSVISTLLICAQSSDIAIGDQDSNASDASGDWTPAILRSELLTRVPPANLQRIFEHLEPVEVAAGDAIIHQGDTGEFYYIIQRGECEVTRQASEHDQPVPLARLAEGESFGEEALLSDAKRNATVTMLSPGMVMRMTKDDFVELIRDPMLAHVARDAAEELAAAGAVWLDVRLADEHHKNGIEGSINIPLAQIRARRDELDSAKTYLVYCNSGRRSAAAAFLLSERGLSTYTLSGGLLEVEVPTHAAAPATAKTDDTDKLHAALARVNTELEQALVLTAEVDAKRQVADAEALREGEQARADATEHQHKLEQESERAMETLAQARQRKLDLEAQMRAAEAEAAGQRKKAEVIVERLREQADARLREEKQRLQKEYAQATGEMQKLRQARATAEARFREEKERLEAELARAREQMDLEARRIKDELNTARREAEEGAETIRARQQAEEQRLREETEARLRDERKRLEAEITLSVAAQEDAKHTLETANTALQDARQDAGRMAAEFKAATQRRHAEEEARLERERERLQRETTEAEAVLESAQQAKADAEAAHRDLASTIVELGASEDKSARAERLHVEIKAFEGKLAEADEQLDVAKHAKQAADKQQLVAEEQFARQRAREEELRVQMAEEAEQWLRGERERSEEELEKVRQEAREQEESLARRDAAKRKAQAAAVDMMSDIAAQLGAPEDEDVSADDTRIQVTTCEQKASLAREAMGEATAEKQQAQEALSRAREQIAKLKVQHEEV